MTLSRRAKIEFVMKYNQQNFCITSSNDIFKTTCDWIFDRVMKKLWKIKLIKIIVVIAIVYAVIIDDVIVSIFDFSINVIINNTNDDIFDMTNIDTTNHTSNISQIDMNLKYFCFNDVIIYDQWNAIKSIIVLIDEYQDLFPDNDITIDISKKNECQSIWNQTQYLSRLKFIRLNKRIMKWLTTFLTNYTLKEKCISHFNLRHTIIQCSLFDVKQWKTRKDVLS